MGPILICDKSTLQALSAAELNLLRRNYSLNIPPVLLMEILADLKKPGDTVARSAEVQTLANKLLPACSAVNMGYRDLLVGEILGHEVKADGRPILCGGHPVQAGGKAGFIFEPSPEDTALLRWQAGSFLEAEELLADAWRRASRAIDLESVRRMWRKNYDAHVVVTSLAEAADIADQLLSSVSPAKLLLWFLSDCEIRPDNLIDAVVRIESDSHFSLPKQLPYTARCLRLSLIFHVALAFGMISTRATNRIDLEYLYYLPFCMVFSSGDALHSALVPFLLRADQMFVERDVLKADLQGHVIWWSSLTEEEKEEERQRSGPPEYEHSVTYKAWKKFMKSDYRTAPRLKEKISPDAEHKMMEHITELMKNAVSGDASSTSLEDCDFVVRKHNVRLDGPCICGSEKLFRDCCGRKIVAALQKR